MYDFFNRQPNIDFLPWDKWAEYEGNREEVSHTITILHEVVNTA